MTAIDWLVLLGWIPAAGFLIVHTRAMITAEERPLPSWAVLIMATVVAIVMTMALFRYTLNIELPREVRVAGYALILIGLWVKFIGILYVRYGPLEKPAPPAKRDQIGADS